jgi:putative acetyltransferase
MRIRVATNLDRDDVRDVHWCAFSEGEKQMVSALAVNLLSEKTNPETISLVAEVEGAVLGHIAFSPVFVENDKCWVGYILAPLGVKPAYQKSRIGSKLIESGMQRLSKMGVNVVFVYGDPKYYRKFGFSADVASGYSPPYSLQYPFGWQAVVLNEDGFSAFTGKISCVAALSNSALW